jgi:hypothetical protein
MAWIIKDRPEKEPKKKKGSAPSPIFITDKEMEFVSFRPISKKHKSGIWSSKIKKAKKWETTFTGLIDDKITIEIIIKHN